jgi:hypothetical protein
MARYYILDDHGDPQPVDDMFAFFAWYESADNRIALAEMEDVTVSTVFIGRDSQFRPGGPPLIYETMCFGPGQYNRSWRYSTRQEALDGHRRAVQIVTGETDDPGAG